ncbi:alpha/beta fold hydrolase [Streptomyces sp. GbtcB6]|uniref:alpha/beta fold hydrolase n=1 Tax=Streptomyces sp. GbtcB6 TaxID=2824751 RepID=UPI001C2F7441|nr:alpha/beta hydrolase [Streptomyces sp. GbtcB6]
MSLALSAAQDEGSGDRKIADVPTDGRRPLRPPVPLAQRATCGGAHRRAFFTIGSRTEERTVHHLQLSRTVDAKPITEWKSVAVELLGTQTRIVRGPKYRHRVIEAGSSGDALVLIHGIGGHAETFARNLHNLVGAGFHVFAVDALFHGYSSWEPYVDDGRAARQAEGVVDLLDGLGIERAHVEGESMGATIAFEFGMNHPERAGKIIMNTGFGDVVLTKTDFAEQPNGGVIGELSRRALLEPTFRNVRARMEWLVASPERMTDEMVEIRRRLYSDPGVFNSMKRVFRVGTDWETKPRWTEEQVRNFTPEALVFWTEHNPGEGPDYGEYVASLLPDAAYYCMADAAHWPQWERPEEHDQVLIDFIAGS